MKTLLIIGAGVDQLPAYELARDMGLRTIAFDYNPDAPAFNISDFSYCVSTKDVTKAVTTALKINEQIHIDGVITLGAEVSPTVSGVAVALNLPGVPPKVALYTTNKCHRAEIFSEAGIRFPKYSVLEDTNTVKDLHYPLVIKPSDNSASRGVRIVENLEQLKSAFPNAKKLSSDDKVIVEEFIPGDQISIEGIVVDGKLYVTAIADRNYSRNSYFYPLMVEDGGEMPSRHCEKTIAAMCLEFSRAVDCLDIKTGPTKGDLIISKDGDIYVIEVTSRLSGGGFCSRVVPRVNGINIVKTTIELALGSEVDTTDLNPKFSKGMCHRYYFHKPGTITSIDGLEKAKSMPGVMELVINQPFSVGTTLEEVNYANRLFYIITIAETRKLAIELAELAMDSVTIETQDKLPTVKAEN
ncbi:MAG: biotin carboxylase [Flavobacteriales bacterium]|jgi:biotin carboxylase